MQWLLGITSQLRQAALQGGSDLGLVLLVCAGVMYFTIGRMGALITGCVAAVFMIGAQPILNGIQSMIH